MKFGVWQSKPKHSPAGALRRSQLLSQRPNPLRVPRQAGGWSWTPQFPYCLCKTRYRGGCGQRKWN